MKTTVSRWGNSLGVRIPKEIAAELGLTGGKQVDIVVDGKRIVITCAQPRYKLRDLLAGMTPEAMRDAFDWGPDVGAEIIE
jgi:antitoxin MazE